MEMCIKCINSFGHGLEFKAQCLSVSTNRCLPLGIEVVFKHFFLHLGFPLPLDLVPVRVVLCYPSHSLPFL